MSGTSSISENKASTLQSVTIDGEKFYRISGFDSIRPFLMSVVSDSDHWMFISSNGGLTAGRKNPEYSLFPYYTVDKLHELNHTTGSKTIVRIKQDSRELIWEPFSTVDCERFEFTRNLYKNKFGDKVRFEEVNHDLGLTFYYQWSSSDEFGFIKTASLSNHSDQTVEVTVLDGIQNVMPYGVSSDLQTRASNLVDAYKRSELVADTGLGVFALSAIIVDKAEPSEALKTNVVWSMGLENPKYLLSSQQLENFRKRKETNQEEDIKGEKGAYFVEASLQLESGSEKKWIIVANVNLNHAEVIRLNESIKHNADLEKQVKDDISVGTDKLIALVAASDGLQKTRDSLGDSRHFSNVLFNIMRGGIFDDNYNIDKKDFARYIRNANNSLFNNNEAFFKELSDQFDKPELDELLSKTEDPDLLRLSKEYLPLKFSRRHGDPSRPWNKFSINTRSEVDGSKILDYEGNWRDIFQNWEALAHSYPEFMEGMIFKFLNATTFDGYNPYRVTKGGFDWEIIEPDDPWSYIGYWGDHQIIYLLKFLEFYHNHKPGELERLFSKELFVYANVPYRIKKYEDIAKDPKNTIDFDEESDRRIRDQVDEKGADGALLSSKKEEIHHVNFIEKILVTLLAKVSNFIPEAGIWMNTQRPEWNDANNALVGNGVSMVTLYYLRRFLKFFEPIVSKTELDEVTVSKEVAELFYAISEVLAENQSLLDADINDADRKRVTEGLGIAGSTYREKVYDSGFSGESQGLKTSDISSLIEMALTYMEHSIRANKRDDKLYHAYNLMSLDDSGISISYLDEMLEGQVAALSSGYLNTQEAVALLDALKSSALYREDQQSYLLYPNKDLAGFLERNNIPEESVQESILLKKLIDDQNFSIIIRDVKGGYHFNGNFKNAVDLNTALDGLKETGYAELVEKEEKLVLRIFEEVFNHKAFTGRSGTFFGYEGLGSIYWHMVSKLYLAVYEVCKKASDEGADEKNFSSLAQHFDEIAEGIGVHKSPGLYGAFPTDAYSHTPQHRGAQQPGMTGQVKEDVLVRFGELGLEVNEGQLCFKPFLLKSGEFLNSEEVFSYKTLAAETQNMDLEEGSIAFTYCQVPVSYTTAEEDGINIKFTDGSTRQLNGLKVDAETSGKIFSRSGQIQRISVSLRDKYLR